MNSRAAILFFVLSVKHFNYMAKKVLLTGNVLFIYCADPRPFVPRSPALPARAAPSFRATASGLLLCPFPPRVPSARPGSADRANGRRHSRLRPAARARWSACRHPRPRARRRQRPPRHRCKPRTAPLRGHPLVPPDIYLLRSLRLGCTVVTPCPRFRRLGRDFRRLLLPRRLLLLLRARVR